jgi:UDP-3-O-[3-hydroxymyristoyl] glucosamine N-acyltransferase
MTERLGNLAHIDLEVYKMLDPSVKIEPGSIIYNYCSIGMKSIIGANAVLRPFTFIGHHSIFGTASVSEGHCDIGNYTTIHAQCHITQGVHIGNNVFIAPFFIASNTPEITEGKHGTGGPEKVKIKHTYIEDNVRIGINVRMIPGLRIRKGALIDQDCLITHDVPAYAHIRGGKDKIGRPI